MSASTTSDIMDEVLSDLKRDYWEAWASYAFSVLGSMADSAKTSLSVADKDIAYLSGELRNDVLAGNRPFADWQALAVDAHGLLASLLSYVDKWSMLGRMEQVARGSVDVTIGTVRFVGETVGKVASGVSSSLPMLLLIVGGIVMLLLISNVRSLAS